MATDRRPPFSVRLQDAEDDLKVGSAAAGESRSEFARRAIQERAARVLEEERRSGDRSEAEREEMA